MNNKPPHFRAVACCTLTGVLQHPTQHVAQLLRNSNATARYRAELHRIPPPGTGCHPFLLRVANLGRMAGVLPAVIMQDIRDYIPSGTRPIQDGEIRDAVLKATSTPALPTRTRTTRPARDLTDVRQRYIDKSRGVTEADLQSLSPVELVDDPLQHAEALLDLYDPDENVMIGDEYSRAVRPVTYHRDVMLLTGVIPSHIIPNPFDGHEHFKHDGSLSTRCDAAVADYRFALVEFDNMAWGDQLAFMHTLVTDRLLPVAALIDSGSKSLHAWIRLDLPDAEHWRTVVRQNLYDARTGYMARMGADRACQNPSRLSRMPGHLRKAPHHQYQRLLYLDGGARTNAIHTERAT